jgi:O-methyltransferase involved in polyketide biosynthesis
LTGIIVINISNDAVMYYKFAKSTTVRENESIGDNLDERSRIYFRHGAAGWRAASRLQRGRTISSDTINGHLYSLSRSLNVLFRRIVTSHHSRISPTAKLAAFLRAETDIPYCRQIAEMCDAEEVSRTFNPGFIANHRAYIELRFKSLNAFIHRLGFRQVFEFAGGVAPRGLILSQDPSMRIVETDLPELLEEKRSMVKALIPLSERTNYHLHPANALQNEEVWNAAGFFKRDPITVVHEGLLQFLTMSERRQFAGNISSLLKVFGGAWTTSDVVIRESFERFYPETKQASTLKRVTDLTGRRIAEDAFVDWEAATSFFKEEGFAVERFKQIDLVPEMQSRVFEPQVLERIEYEEVWVMRLMS